MGAAPDDTGASLGLTYSVCIRLMRRGHCAMMMPIQQPSCAADSTTDRNAQIARLRAEVAQLSKKQHLYAQ